MKTPSFFAGACIKGGNPATHAELTTGGTDDDLALGYTRRHGDRIAIQRIVFLGGIEGQRGPSFFAGGGIERNQPAIERADINFAFVSSQTAIDQSAAHLGRPFAGYLGVVLP